MADFADGFDCYATFADAYAGYWDSGAGTPTFVAGRFSGSQALHVTATSTLLTKSNGANDAVHHLVVAFRQTAAISGTTLGLYLQLLDGTTGQCCVVFRSDGAILLTSGTPAGAVLDTYAGAFPVTNTWYAFEIEVAINNTTGSWAVRKNGNTVNDRALGSLDTQNSANAYANKLTVGMQAAVNSHEIDDLYWRSSAATGTFLGDLRAYTRAAASDAAVQFSRTPGASNFSCVDEPQQNTTTDYVYDSSVGHEDYYGIASIASTPVITHMVVTRAYMRKSDAGTRTAAVQLKSGGTAVASPTLTLATPPGWLWAWRSDTTNPATSSAWTAAAVNNVTVGPRVIA